MNYDTVIEPSEAAQALGDASWLFVDCRFVLDDGDAGRNAYVKSHIPGAVYADLERDLSGPIQPGTGRHPLPQETIWRASLGRLGVTADTQVVAYDDAAGAMAAARLWWLLKWAGHEHVAVLNGGLSAWLRAGLPTDARPPQHRRQSRFDREFRPELLADADELLARADDHVLVDVRASDRYTGDNEPIDAVSGHIPGAYSLPYSGNVDDDGAFLSPQELKERFGPLRRGRDSEVIFYCGSGVTAAHNVLAFRRAYAQMPRLYAGSWSEWITDPTRPIARGEETAGNAAQ